MNSIKVCFTGAVRLAPDAFLPQLCDQEVTVNRQPGLHTAAGGADSCTHCLLWVFPAHIKMLDDKRHMGNSFRALLTKQCEQVDSVKGFCLFWSVINICLQTVVGWK